MREALAILATFRLARLFVVDDGPDDVFLKLRVWAGVYDIGQNGEPSRWAGRLLSCQFCVGIWCAMFVAPLVLFATTPGDIILMWLGIAGGQALIEMVCNGHKS